MRCTVRSAIAGPGRSDSAGVTRTDPAGHRRGADDVRVTRPRTEHEGSLPQAPAVDPEGLSSGRSRLRRPGFSAAVIVGLPAVGAVLWVAGLVSYANHDRMDLLDLPRVNQAAEAACTRVADALETDSAIGRAERLAAGHAAIDELVSTMSSLGRDELEADRPAIGWIADWRSLRTARQEVADALSAQPEVSLVVPQTPDGYPITRRMTIASGPSCGAAIALAAQP